MFSLIIVCTGQNQYSYYALKKLAQADIPYARMIPFLVIITSTSFTLQNEFDKFALSNIIACILLK